MYTQEERTQSRPSLKLKAYQYLREKILNCEYQPGERLNEQKLCFEMGNISRTPMRDALGRLEQEGLVKILPKKGLIVSDITPSDVAAIYEVRLIVEPYALRNYGVYLSKELLLKAREEMLHPERIVEFCAADDAFHTLVVSVLPNKYLRSAYEGITAQNTRFRIMTGKAGQFRAEEACREHLAVLDAALQGDWNGAAVAMEQHLLLARDMAFRSLRELQEAKKQDKVE